MNISRPITKRLLPILTMAAIGFCTVAQDTGVVRREAGQRRGQQKEEAAGGPKVTQRMQGFFETKEPHDADLAYMREIYRSLDLTKAENTPLYFPEDVVDGQQNLFRIILGLVVDGKVPAYEYLDGREVFTDQYRVKVGDMLDRFDIYYQKQGEGNKEQYTIEEADVPTGQVLKYYIVEKWEFDRRSNRMKTRVEAICPVLSRNGDFGGEANYPMFWVKFDQLRPFLAQQYVFLSDDNNLPQYSLDDYFNLGMYDGEIYKTKNLRNLSMAQMFPDEDDMKRAQDSIDKRLREFGKNLWVPDREEYLAMKEAEEEAKALAEAAGDSIPERTTVSHDDEEQPAKTRASKRSARKKSSSDDKKSEKKTSTKKPKSTVKQAKASNTSSAAKSVRRRKK